MGNGKLRGGAWRRRLRHFLEGAAVRVAFAAFRLMGIDAASSLGGWVARTIGPWLGTSGRAARNLRSAFPEAPAGEIDRIIRGMWENLGRVVGEFPHLHDLDLYAEGGRVEVVGPENLDALLDDGRPSLSFTAHFGNWEITPLGIIQRGLPLAYVYRAANNPIVDRVIYNARHDERIEQIPKGAIGARRALALLRASGHLAMLVDQRMNDGIPVPFFGRAAMTAPALAQFALKFRCPVVPVKAERLNGARFRLTFFPPLTAVDTGDRAADVAAFMTRVNAMIEEWVRERPEQWLWLHQRWGAGNGRD